MRSIGASTSAIPRVTKDRFVPLPDVTLDLLRRFWRVHRNPMMLFPNRRGGLGLAHCATTPLDRTGVRNTLRKVI